MFGIESASEPTPRRGGCIRLRLYVAGKQIRRVHTYSAVCTKAVLSAVSITANEKKTRAFGRQTRTVKAKNRAIYDADLFAFFAGTKAGPSKRETASERKIASTCTR